MLEHLQFQPVDWLLPNGFLDTRLDFELTYAKNELRTNGRLYRQCSVFCSAKNALAALPDFPFLRPVNIAGSSLNQFQEQQMIELRIALDGPPELMLAFYKSFNPQFQAVSQQLMDMLTLLGTSSKDVPQMLIDTLLRLHKVPSENWIVSKFFRHLVTRFKAFAYTHSSEAWMASAKTHDRTKLAPSLADEPTAHEVIMISAETRDSQRIVMVPFERSARGTGKVTSFGDPYENVTGTGNLCHILSPFPTEN